MPKLTRSNIAYDLTISPHVLPIEYHADNVIEYVFSSELYKQKFLDQRDEQHLKIKESLSKRFGYEVGSIILSDLVLYRKIEKRGFLLKINEDVITCPELVRLDGMMPIIKS